MGNSFFKVRFCFGSRRRYPPAFDDIESVFDDLDILPTPMSSLNGSQANLSPEEQGDTGANTTPTQIRRDPVIITEVPIDSDGSVSDYDPEDMQIVPFSKREIGVINGDDFYALGDVVNVADPDAQPDEPNPGLEQSGENNGRRKKSASEDLNDLYRYFTQEMDENSPTLIVDQRPAGVKVVRNYAELEDEEQKAEYELFVKHMRARARYMTRDPPPTVVVLQSTLPKPEATIEEVVDEEDEPAADASPQNVGKSAKTKKKFGKLFSFGKKKAGPSNEGETEVVQEPPVDDVRPPAAAGKKKPRKGWRKTFVNIATFAPLRKAYRLTF